MIVCRNLQSSMLDGQIFNVYGSDATKSAVFINNSWSRNHVLKADALINAAARPEKTPIIAGADTYSIIDRPDGRCRLIFIDSGTVGQFDLVELDSFEKGKKYVNGVPIGVAQHATSAVNQLVIAQIQGRTFIKTAGTPTNKQYLKPDTTNNGCVVGVADPSVMPTLPEVGVAINNAGCGAVECILRRL
jgi:hypothetical protein